MSQAELDALYASYAAARNAANYAVAIGCLMDMKARLATSPSRASRALGGAGSQSIEFSGELLDSLIADCRRLKAESAVSSGPLVLVPVKYARAGDTGDFT